MFAQSYVEGKAGIAVAFFTGEAEHAADSLYLLQAEQVDAQDTNQAGLKAMYRAVGLIAATDAEVHLYTNNVEYKNIYEFPTSGISDECKKLLQKIRRVEKEQRLKIHVEVVSSEQIEFLKEYATTANRTGERVEKRYIREQP